jgi:hypothetical protein
MKLHTKLMSSLSLMMFLPFHSANSMQSIEEENLRYVSGQSGIDADLNFKGTIGRAYFETNGNSLNMRNLSIDTDASGGNDGVDRPVHLVMDLITEGKKSGLGIAVTNINDMDLKFEQLNVNGDTTAGAIVDEIVGQMHSFGGLALSNINDNGGYTDIKIFARGASEEEGLEIKINFPDALSMRLDYTDYGADNTITTDDYTFGGDLILNNFSIENSVDLTSIKNANGEEIGGLHIGVITQTGDLTLSNIRAGNQLGTMGRLVVNGYQMMPDSYLTIQGK